MKEFITSDFARIPRSLQFLSRWKATELRLFLLYVGIVALKGNVKTEVYQLFSLLFVASRIIASKELSLDSQLLDYAEKLLCSFVKHSADNSVLGPTFVTINVHNLLHLVDDVRKFGSINEFDAFPFENHLRIIRGMMRSGVKVARQMVNRLSERDLCYKASILKESKLTPLQYDRVANEYACLSSSSFTVSAVKKRDSYFFTDHSICHLRKITKRGDSVTIVADCCDDTQSFFTYPTDSRLVGVFKINRQQTRKKVEMCIDDIKGKVMVLPHGDERIAIKLVHTI
ncbi:hypothetical protein ONE63_011273 [Megalurothrips usitatus]|uniref:Uncharacterized protein n=1 Tax=Megalurothrips usitatus TaxID=439358 RepID=A0AAV7X524_9NEOP|nr:hypothetical protein ONE63_011273 [Megalurothrips usitatus]